MGLKVYNTLTRRKEEFVPLTPGQARMYVCGITAYDLCHIGHARSAIVFDVIRRYLEFKGYEVRFIKNFTDVDDKIIRRANEEGVSPRELSERYVEASQQDMESLGVRPADVEPKATEHISQMIGLIERLIGRGAGYIVDGDVYFEVRKFPPYGRLSGKNLDELLAGARVEVDERKRDPLDFALWKASKLGEPSWQSPWGPGRPGWHIECSAMSMEYLGDSFDIHGGGEDLIFPHHENEIAQSEAGTGCPFVRYWVHNGFVKLGAEKMSKSLGNILTIKELVRRYEPDALRLWLLGAHYRNPIEFSEEHIQASTRALERLRALVDEARRFSPSESLAAFQRNADENDHGFLGGVFAQLDGGSKPIIGRCMQRFSEAMDDDFNTSEAIAAVFALTRELRVMVHDAGRVEEFRNGVRVLLTLSGVLGLLERGSAAPEVLPDFRDRIQALVAERDEARNQRDWGRADALRAELRSLGVTVEDTPSGTRWRWWKNA